MSSARQLLYQYVQGHVTDWYNPFVLNMRQIRGYDNYWRPIDTEAYIDGPVSQQMGYSKDEIIWKVEIVKDIEDNLTNTINLYKVLNYTEAVAEYNSWDEIPNFKYNLTEPTFTYEHTDPIDSVSLEFDQSGRRLIAFESAGNINFIWYDPVPAEFVVTNYGAGYNPFVVTDTYRRTGGSADSERLLFYVKDSTKQIVYRRQLDRYQTEYTLPSAPSDVIELIKVSKNIYGGLTVLYCYETGGELVTGSFTAESEASSAHLGTDNNVLDLGSFNLEASSILNFTLKIAGVPVAITDSTDFVPSTAAIQNFELLKPQVIVESEADTTTFSLASGNIVGFELVAAKVVIEPSDTTALTYSTAAVQSFTLKQGLITVESFGNESAELSPNTGTITGFTLG